MSQLFPSIKPFKQEMLEVSGGHSIFVEQTGSPDGIPVLYLHGGPGGSIGQEYRRFFDPEKYWIIGFDQNSKETLEDFSFTKKNALILGSEGFGIKPLIKSQCDNILKIDISNELESLNVSNASAVILYELAKKNRPN